MTMSKLLELLVAHSGQYVSGEMISRELNVSRTAIWKQIHKLEDQGYEIEASRRLGYKLISVPDKYSLDDLNEQLQTAAFGRSIHLFEQVDSTQNVAQKLAEEGAPEGTLVIAEQQLSGRGRMGRAWMSPKGKGVWMSLIMRPTIPVHFAPQLTLLTAVALCRSLARLTSLPIGIKWPNDLLIDGKKISGILLESTAEDARLRYVIAGVGISVNLASSDYPEEMQERVTSLRIASGERLSREAVIAAFMLEWEQLYTLYQAEGFAPVVTLWEALSVSLNKPARLTTPQGIIDGTPVALDESGAIAVRLEDGNVVLVFSAEMGEPVT
ncbi:biotin--[acetyl-CoA-carboxylase] ligase [Paenibacillus radicis (ex Gao et al. 2016)]|uniref:Bifunctional ligase/repressor BirA n=1 Tax=Paenibacillus radicis (ex Gao et al. 2016) TaxID=1737354 RepID=A0A917GWS0_9BACL|nr:biotin--[acetyl-CoA-carboxylase] ligase [Paenibacillus radicis (ex Gao et al. 2016)]GGG58489.1 bifunctional ligase/repressor BirA [Paenibacillus radicis (ex Gao et al. 2016)]